MLLVILGLIVVGGALFLIFSQFKPAIGRRLRGGYHGFGFGGFDGLGAFQDENNSFKTPFGDNAEVPNEADGNAESHDADEQNTRDDEGKVLFIFGSGEREERSLNEDDDKDK